MYEVDKIQFLQIGVQGENDATDIEIDMSAWAEKYPDAQFHILFKPYNASAPSPMLTTYEAGVLTWTVGVGATAVVGVGYTEIRAQDSETGLVKKSKIIPTAVENSVSGVETTPPASYQEWVTAVLNAGADAKTGAAAVLAYSHGAAIMFEIGDSDAPEGKVGHLLFYYKEEGDESWQGPLDLGSVDVYAMAVEEGYTGTKAQWVQSMEDAEENAQKSEKYATGKLNGTDVSSDDPTYHNNSKYYSEQAAGDASDSEAYAAGTRGGTAVDSDDPAYHNNAGYYAGQAAGSATSAAASAADALEHTQSVIETWLGNNIDPDSGYALDRTLALQNAAAPADLVGGLSGEVIDVKNQFERDVTTQFTVPCTIDLGTLVASGKLQINGNNGADDTSYTRTGYIQFSFDTMVYIDSDEYEFLIWTYSTSSASNKVERCTPEKYIPAETPTIIRHISPATRFRIGVRRKDLVALTTSTSDTTADYYKILNKIKFFKYTDETLTVQYSPADSKVVGDNIKAIKDMVIKTVYPEMNIVNGSLNDHGAPSPANADKRLRSGYIPIDYKLGFSVEVPSGLKVSYFLYGSKSSDDFISMSDTYTEDFTVSSVTSSAKYVRLWIRKTNDSALSPSDASSLYLACYYSEYILFPAKGTTDQTDEITWLIDTGCCHFAPGTFYTTGVTMMEGSSIIGSGNATKLILSGSNAGNCISMGKNCTVKDIEVVGSLTDIELSSTIGERNGISCIGTGASDTSWRCTISGCYVHGFTGGGISLKDIGDGWGVNICDCYCFNCCVGINVIQNVNYTHITNCTMTGCYYACIENGANNLMTCCSFVSSYYGLMMGNTEGEYIATNTRGGAVNCNFGHNTIRAIYMNYRVSGYTFTGCTISQNGVEIIKCTCVVFTGCNMLSNFSLTVTGKYNNSTEKGVTLFGDCVFRPSFTGENINITNNDNVHFDNCYYSDGTVCDPVAS